MRAGGAGQECRGHGSGAWQAPSPPTAKRRSDLLDLAVFEFNRGSPAEDRHRHLQPRAHLIDFLDASDGLGHFAHRMGRQVEAEELLLPAEPLADRCLGGGGERRVESGRIGGAEVEERSLARDPVALDGLAGGRGVIEA